MKRIAVMLLLVGAMLGLAVQAPARALTPPTDAQRAAKMASMPDCMAAMEKTSDKRCDCTRADCIAAMMGGASVLTLADLDGAPKTLVARSDERRVGKEGVSTCSSRWSPYHKKKKENNNQ